MVYLHHFNPFEAYKLENNSLGHFGYAVCNELYVGVTVFFCLSGFLIAHRYLNRVEFTKEWAFNYFRNRFARIYPMYFLLTLLTFLICLQNPGSNYIGPSNVFTTQSETILIFFLNISFLRGFSDTIKYTGIAQGWSLTVEETFYFCAPIILWLVAGNKKWLLFFLFILPALGTLFVLIFERIPMLGVMDNHMFMWSYTFFGRCSEFLAGIFLALVLRSAPVLTRYRMFTWVGTVLIGACVVLLGLVKGPNAYGNLTYEGVLINNLLLASVIVLFFYGLLTEKTMLQRLLSSEPLQLLGKSSYVFYLIHMSFISMWIDENLPNFPIGKFLLLNLLAIGIYKFAEEPINGILRKKLVYRRR